MPEQDSRIRIEQEALEWFLKHNDQIDARSERAFKAWLEIDPEHQAAYLQWQQQWDALDAVEPQDLAALRATQSSPQVWEEQADLSWWQRCKDKVADLFLGPSTRQLAIAGAVCMVVGVGGLGIYGRYLDQPVFVATYQTREHEQHTVELSDHTVLSLQPQTRLQVNYYPQRRELQLESGQVHLNVAPDSERPFLVLYEQYEMQTQAARFTVSTHPQPEIQVESGQVQIHSTGPWWKFATHANEPTTLGPGERAHLSKSPHLS